MARLKVRRTHIELLPVAADEAVLWALQMERDGRLSQRDVLAGLNDRLQQVGLGPVSKSALNRFLQRVRDGEAPARFLEPPRGTEALVALIDQRIALALQARGPA